jgi:hypothetical protein
LFFSSKYRNSHRSRILMKCIFHLTARFTFSGTG